MRSLVCRPSSPRLPQPPLTLAPQARSMMEMTASIQEAKSLIEAQNEATSRLVMAIQLGTAGAGQQA